MEKETWRFIDLGNGSPSFNMALDEALLDWHSEGKFPQLFVFMAGIRQPYRLAISKRLKKKLIWMQLESIN